MDVWTMKVLSASVYVSNSLCQSPCTTKRIKRDDRAEFCINSVVVKCETYICTHTYVLVITAHMYTDMCPVRSPSPPPFYFCCIGRNYTEQSYSLREILSHKWIVNWNCIRLDASHIDTWHHRTFLKQSLHFDRKMQSHVSMSKKWFLWNRICVTYVTTENRHKRIVTQHVLFTCRLGHYCVREPRKANFLLFYSLFIIAAL